MTVEQNATELALKRLCDARRTLNRVISSLQGEHMKVAVSLPSSLLAIVHQVEAARNILGLDKTRTTEASS